MKEIVVDASGCSVGRVSSYAAKQVLLGNNVKIVNCNDSFVTGNKKSVIEEYKIMRARGGASLQGPHYPKSPERIMKRTIRGMLPYKQGKGREAFKRILCYNKVPVELEKSEKVSLKREVKSTVTTLARIGREF